MRLRSTRAQRDRTEPGERTDPASGQSPASDRARRPDRVRPRPPLLRIEDLHVSVEGQPILKVST